MLYWFDLYVSMRHGGYATKDERLHNDWNRFFGFKLDAEKFLGYPECCVRDVSGFGSNLLLYQLYSLVKNIRYRRRSIAELRDFLKNYRFIHHVPCNFVCVNTIALERKYETAILKHIWLVRDLLNYHYSKKVKDLIELFISLKEHTQERINMDIRQLRDSNIIIRLEINPDDILEIVTNKRATRENIAYAVRLLRSNWKCMLEGFN